MIRGPRRAPGRPATAPGWNHDRSPPACSEDARLRESCVADRARPPARHEAESTRLPRPPTVPARARHAAHLEAARGRPLPAPLRAARGAGEEARGPFGGPWRAPFDARDDPASGAFPASQSETPATVRGGAGSLDSSGAQLGIQVSDNGPFNRQTPSDIRPHGPVSKSRSRFRGSARSTCFRCAVVGSRRGGRRVVGRGVDAALQRRRGRGSGPKGEPSAFIVRDSRTHRRACALRRPSVRVVSSSCLERSRRHAVPAHGVRRPCPTRAHPTLATHLPLPAL